MDDMLKIAGRHFNYNCKGGLSCTCPGCAGPTRTRIANMIAYVDKDEPRNRERSRQADRKLSKTKRALKRRAKSKVKCFVKNEIKSQICD